jgi:hypothetical protein
VCALALCTAGFADVTLDWVSPGSNVWQGFYVSPYTADIGGNPNDSLSIFCIDYNHEIAPPTEWKANIAQFSSSNVSQYQYGGTTSFAFQTDTAKSSDGTSSVEADLSTSNLTDRYLELVWLATQMETALTDSSLSTASRNAVLDIYQAADWLVFADSNHLPGLEDKIKGTDGTYSFNSGLGLWGLSSGPGGNSFQFAVDSVLNAAETEVVTDHWDDVAGWSVVTGDATANQGPVQEFLTYTPPSNGLSPVPEPSQIVLMFTVLGLIVLAAKRSSVTRWLGARR